MTDYQPWHPMTDPVDLKTLGKLAEEANELGAIISRCVIQGAGEHNLKEGKPNIECVQDEIADVLVNIILVRERFNLDLDAIVKRVNDKEPKLRAWHGMA